MSLRPIIAVTILQVRTWGNSMAEAAPLDLRAWRKTQRARLLEARRTCRPTHTGSKRKPSCASWVCADCRRKHEMIACYCPFAGTFNCVPFMREILRSAAVALPW